MCDYKIIDIEKWNRSAVFKNFINYDKPTVSLTVEINVTKILQKTKEKKESFFVSLVYCLTKAMNDIPEMRYRIVGDDVVQFERTEPSFIVLSDENVIQTCIVKFSEDRALFLRRCAAEIEKCRKEKQESFSTGETGLIYISNVKWYDFTSLSNPYNYSDRESTSIPRVAFGKYYMKGDEFFMHMDLSAHHALVDGKPMCDLFTLFQRYLNEM